MNDPILAKRDKNPGGGRGRMAGKKEERGRVGGLLLWRRQLCDFSAFGLEPLVAEKLESSEELQSPLASNGEPRY